MTSASLPSPPSHRAADALRLAAPHEPAERLAQLRGDERLPESIGFANHAGRGVTALVGGKAAAVGSARLLEELGIDVPAELRAAREPGATTVLVAWGGEARAALHLRDEPRADSAPAIAALRALGLDVVLATGDGPDAASAIGDAVGVTDIRSSLLPADKDALVQQLQSEGRRVAMVGDGINDSPALARADLGIAIGTGADVAIEASDLTLVSPSLWAAVDSIRLARATLGRIRRNLFWAFAYNVAAIPLAVAGLLEPMVAGAAMAASSVFVVGGSLLLRRFRPSPR